MELIFELSSPGRGAAAQHPPVAADLSAIPEALRRKEPPRLPEVSELQAVRHYTRLSRLNFSIDTQFYPLGSCTMKYNPRACNKLAMLPEFLGRHPLAPESHSQGYLACLYELQEMLRDVTGMAAVSLTPMAGAQGEFAGVAMIRAYHHARGDTARREILVPDAAHGTNPATATMLGYVAREIPTDAQGDVDIEKLKAAVGPQTAGIMLTNPSTLGVFERRIKEIAGIVHTAGGLLYYDGANLNAILGKVRPGDMGFDVIHMNLHKTFSTPHGGGGPGAGAVGVSERLRPFMPIPVVGVADGRENREKGDLGSLASNDSRFSTPDSRSYRWLDENDLPQSIGRLSAFMGNAGVLMRAYVYARLLGREGMHRVAEFAALNANYLSARLKAVGFDLAYPTRRASHEFIITLKKQKQELDLTATDVAKRLLDHGYHAPTVYFPLLVPECLLIEPTETEDLQTLDAFVDAMTSIWNEARSDMPKLKGAPWTLPVRRLDDVRCARQLDLRWQPAP
ncbi:glycine dehydrogenase (decarboxylating) beta subunit [Panacagrimonas perspica]|uniref:Probable glycine dehydrogenase (decarboxylating) subunit 2 n=1 Tax=Panacagrimonas perspica TaxID=381431 RepID=A0A4R7PD21_9GAMM|nr:aminomethyl-transferring glycine dehydrogenase subunit GcvPB [Panacagrimonas perspica]TDU31519.1 glycine dehydrogenase (decarboxylating) beta subunit [Panacagrimonas perspica]THD03243.1 glycine dehydrogenase (aminomethyl-transferring) [Panacagrimonas perspica]